MRLTLPHHTTQEEAIKKIDDKINELLGQKYPGIEVIDPSKEWEENIMRFSVTVQKMLFTLDFSGNLIVTDEEVVADGEIPGLLLTFVTEEKIREVLTEEFNKLFDIK